MIGGLLLALVLAQGPGATPEPDPGASVSDPQTPIAVTTRLSPDPSHVGDLLTLEVIAAYPRGFTVNLPIGLELAPLEVVRVEASEPESTGTGMRKIFTVTLQYFDVAEAQVPAFPLTYVDPEGQVETTRVPAHAFAVESLIANEPDPQRQPEDSPVSLEYPNELAETIIYAGLLFLALGAGGALAFSRWRRRVRPVVLPPPVPAHVLALDALDSLAHRRHTMIETGLFQDYYLELTEIAKAYVEGRFGFEALDRTTDEIRRDLLAAAERVAPLDADDLIAFLQECDLVKFARFAPPVEDTEAALHGVRSMVEDTIPRARPVAETPAPDEQEVA